jgi:hypothetical protein
MMEAARTSETLENLYQTTRRYNPEDSSPGEQFAQTVSRTLKTEDNIRSTSPMRERHEFYSGARSSF